MIKLSIEETQRKYDKLFTDVSAALFHEDPMGINFDSNTHEYNHEANSIISGLNTAKTAGEVQAIIYEEFIYWFGAESAGVIENYKSLSVIIWKLWDDYQHKLA